MSRRWCKDEQEVERQYLSLANRPVELDHLSTVSANRAERGGGEGKRAEENAIRLGNQGQEIREGT
jgi:hypothetical protein